MEDLWGIYSKHNSSLTAVVDHSNPTVPISVHDPESVTCATSNSNTVASPNTQRRWWQRWMNSRSGGSTTTAGRSTTTTAGQRVERQQWRRVVRQQQRRDNDNDTRSPRPAGGQRGQWGVNRNGGGLVLTHKPPLSLLKTPTPIVRNPHCLTKSLPPFKTTPGKSPVPFPLPSHLNPPSIYNSLLYL